MKPLMTPAFSSSPEVDSAFVSGPNGKLNEPIDVGSATRIASAKTGADGPGATPLGLEIGATLGVAGGLGVQAVASSTISASGVSSRCGPLGERAMVASSRYGPPGGAARGGAYAR